jgi:hypothetical protein
MHRPAAGLLSLWLTLCLAACQTTPRIPPQWAKAEVSVPSERVLFEVSVLALEEHAFPLGTDFDPATLEAVSGWKNDLAPFRGQGRRERAHVKYRHQGEGAYGVELRVESEVNMDHVRPLDLRYAKWEPAADDFEEAEVLLQRIRSYIGQEIELSPEAPLPWERD